MFRILDILNFHPCDQTIRVSTVAHEKKNVGRNCGYIRPSDLWWARVIVPLFQNMAHHFSMAMGPVDPSFLVVKISQLNKNSHLIASL